MNTRPFYRATLVSYAITLLLICSFTGCSYQPIAQSELERTFDHEFGFPPDHTVSDYRCSVNVIGDSTATWFSFRCGGEIFDKLHSTDYQSGYSTNLMNPVPVWQGDIVMKDPNAPDWWPGVPKSDLMYWKEWQSADKAGHYHYFWRRAGSDRVYSKSAEWQ